MYRFDSPPALDPKTGTPICEKCGAPMRWDAYTCVSRPDILRRSDERAPISWAWHCRCGQWLYDLWTESR